LRRVNTRCEKAECRKAIIACIGIRRRKKTRRGRLASRVDEAFIIPSQTTARIQEAHIFVGHYLCEQIERYLGLT
jgi:phosphoheptose isomerase